MRVDESLYFANAALVEDYVESLLAQDTSIKRVLLACAACNQIDATALGVLTQMEQSLSRRGIDLALAEVKGPVMDRLKHTSLGKKLEGRVYLSLQDAFEASK